MGWVQPRDWTTGELVTEVFLDEQIKGNMDYVKTEIDKLNNIVVVRKTADETVNNSATLQNDDHLLFAIAASEEWVFNAYLFLSSNGTADFQVACTVPSGASMKFGTEQVVSNQAGTELPGSYTDISGDSPDSFEGVSHGVLHVFGWILNSTTPGNVQIQWAQMTATAVDTIVRQGSFLRAYRMA